MIPFIHSNDNVIGTVTLPGCKLVSIKDVKPEDWKMEIWDKGIIGKDDILYINNRPWSIEGSRFFIGGKDVKDI